MKYRVLGKTGLEVSEIGLGCEGFVLTDDSFAEEIFRIALEAGVNCMDLYTPNPDVHRRVGRAIKANRESFVLQAHLCAIWEDGQYRATRDPAEVELAFETMLRNLDTPYIDVGMIHYVDSLETWEQIANGPVMAYALEQKKLGRIHYLGMSSHNPKVAKTAVESGLIDVLLFSINPCYDLLPADENCEALWEDESYRGELVNMDPDREALYELCQRLGVGITVMKAFGGGDLLDAELSPAGRALTVAQCIHYALNRPAVASVMSGVRSVDDLRKTLAYEEASEEERDYAAALASFPRIRWEGNCMYCGHCAPCTVGIDIATVTKFYNLTRAQGGIPETVREHYAALSAHAGDCIGCGACETRCPFGVEIMENMKRAAETFGR